MKKRIVLLGDSIRLGYQPTVQSELADIAEIWAPEGNCMHSVHHLFNIAPWYLEPAGDLIHVNFGLWDCRRLARDQADNVVPVELYLRNLDFILGRVRAATSTPIIWATTTPIVQSRYDARFTRPHEPCRLAADIKRYNAAAAPVLARHGVIINDLHALVEHHERETLICDDGVHYTPEGSQILGRQVAAMIRRHCPPKKEV